MLTLTGIIPYIYYYVTSYKLIHFNASDVLLSRTQARTGHLVTSVVINVANISFYTPT